MGPFTHQPPYVMSALMEELIPTVFHLQPNTSAIGIDPGPQALYIFGTYIQLIGCAELAEEALKRIDFKSSF